MNPKKYFFKVIYDFYQKDNPFSGRVSRLNFWIFFLWHQGFAYLSGVLEAIAQIIIYGDVYYDWGWINSIYIIGCAFPALSMYIKRMHDTNRSGWWLVIPFVNFICLLLPSTDPNRYNFKRSNNASKKAQQSSTNQARVKKELNKNSRVKYPEGKKNYK